MTVKAITVVGKTQTDLLWDVLYGKQRSLKANTSEPKVGAETETEEQQKLKNEKHGTCCAVHSMYKH